MKGLKQYQKPKIRTSLKVPLKKVAIFLGKSSCQQKWCKILKFIKFNSKIASV